MNFLKWCDRAIEYLFYALFLLIPLVFTGNTSELFEFNKMWLTFGLSLGIGFFWFSKMILRRQIIIRRTILDIPILLFLASQVVSTILSLDQHISLWGYYSRWNGGLLSIITYIFLYYAFVSNLANIKVVMRSLAVSVVGGILVVAWALPSHFGHDPTCLAFRHTFDVSCWTADFQPKIRMFGSLGQPDWLAGYLGIILPITGAFVINELRKKKKYLENKKLWFYSLSFILFYVSLLFTGSRAGIGGSTLSLLIMAALYIYLNRKNLAVVKNKFFLGLVAILAILSFLIGVQLPIVSKISFDEVRAKLTKTHTATLAASNSEPTQPPVSSQELGGTNSFEIRKIVWEGAINAWKANPIFGTGVETFAFAYYKYKPAEQNRVSEWNFLYNKAHNEYLNYLATTGIVGLLTYLSFAVVFGAFVKTNLLNLKLKQLKFLKAQKVWDKEDPLILSLLMSFFAILVINFFGFSVVIMNIYLFLIPAFALILYEFLGKEVAERKVDYISYFQWLLVCAVGVLSAFAIFMLIRYWRADVKYALGSNYDQVQQFQTAYPLLHEAVSLRREPVILDEMSVNDAVMATTLASQAATTESAQLVQSLAAEAIATSDELTKKYPHNTVFWKSRVRIFYTLSNIDPRFSPLALEAVKKTSEMAPNDTQILYNKGVLEGQNGDNEGAIKSLERTVSLKPDYADAHFALGVFYHEASVNKNAQITNPNYHEKALAQMQKTVKINPLYTQAQQYFDLWNKE